MHSFYKPLKLAVVFLVLAAAMTIQAFAAAEVKVGSISADALKLRAEPSLEAKIITRAYEDEFVVVLSKENDEWYKVNYKGATGFMAAEFVTVIEEADFDPIAGRITGTNVNVRSEPSTGANKQGQVNTGDAVSVTGVLSGWFKVSYKDTAGYIHPDYMQLNVSSDVPDGDIPLANADSGTASQIIEYAKTFLGTPYKYGSMSGKSFDCSGFTSYVFKKYGISLNRSAAGQLSNGSQVSKADLQPGDLVIFSDKAINKAAASHVGIYIGNGKFIHSSSRRGGVIITDLSDNYYTKHFKCGRRIL